MRKPLPHSTEEKTLKKGITTTTTVLLIIAIIAIAGVAWYVLIPPAAPAEKVIKLGLIFPLTGAQAPFGQDCLKGIQVAIDMINAKGGIAGYTVHAVTADSQSDAAVGASETERLITFEKVNMVVGSYAGPQCMANSEVAEKYGVPFFEAIAAPNEATMNRSFRWIFRFGPAGLYYGYVSVDFLVNFLAPAKGWNVTALRIAVVHESGSYGRSVAAGNLERCEHYGLNVVAHESYSSTATDLSGLITKLNGLDIDVLLITSYAGDAQLFGRQAHELGFEPKAWIGHSAGWELPATATALGNLIIGKYCVGFPLYHTNTTGLLPQVKQDMETFTAMYEARFKGHPASWGAKAASAMYQVAFKALEYAITRYGGIDPESIRKGFLDVDVPEGGTFVGFGCKFNPPDATNNDWGDNFRATFHPIAQWQGTTADDFVVVWPENLAVAKPLL